MPKLILSKKILEDVEKLQSNTSIRKKIAKMLVYLESNPLHPGLHIERIINDPSAWSARIDRKYRMSFEAEKLLPSGNPDWSASITLLCLLTHDDLYKNPR